MSNTAYVNEILLQAKEKLSPDFLIILLGPTASGKTGLAVDLATRIDGEIISADSRQVYKKMDIGTGKDLREYRDLPYHLINIKDPGEKYNVDLFRSDFFDVYDQIVTQRKQAILCGGTGSYIQSVLQERPYTQIPKDSHLQNALSLLGIDELRSRIHEIGIPEDLKVDFDNHKRLVRALEILLYLQRNPQPTKRQRIINNYRVFGLCPPLEQRRELITQRLHKRLEEGLIDEVSGLIENGMDPEDLIYYGLEYKYTTLYLQGILSYGEFFDKLNTEIHRYAKRQMTYFRKMEKDGIKIHWL